MPCGTWARRVALQSPPVADPGLNSDGRSHSRRFGPQRFARADLVLLPLSFAVALASRLLFLFASVERRWPHSVLYEGDALLWTDWLRAMRAGVPFEHGLPIHSPAVPHVLALFGASDLPADWTPYKALWCVLSALACPILYVAALRTVGRGAAVVACAWYALSFHASVLATSLNGEALYALLVMSLVAIGTVQTKRVPGTMARAGVLGVLHGLATLVRAEHTLLMLLLAGWDVARRADGEGFASQRRGRVIAGAAMVVVSVLVCLPWSIAGTRATARMNEWADPLPNYDAVRPAWTADARALMDSLPAFVRFQNVQYLSALAAQAGEPSIDGARVRRYFAEEFGYVPGPLKTPVFVSSQGPLSFALANHPDAGGGFSRAALDARFNPDPNLTFALPTHLKLYNEGYGVGLGYVRENPAAWLSLVGQKFLRFEGGITGGLGVTNVPHGRTLIRQPVDVATAQQPRAWWRAGVLLLIGVGAVRLMVAREGSEWLLIVLAKVVVTVAFYGYARQSASILPAFAVLGACGLAWGLDWSRVGRAAIWAVPAAAVGVTMVTDCREVTRPKLPTIEADQDKVRPARVNAEDGAFECIAPMTIEYISAEGES